MAFATLSVADALSPSSAPLLLLVIPIAIVGRRWGPSHAWAAAILAMAMLAARGVLFEAGPGAIGYVTRATTFVTVAILAGHRPRRLDQANGFAPRDADGAAEPSEASPADLLTKRELEVLEMMAEGATNAEVADRLVIAQSTVQSHVKNILRKLGVRNRTQAVAEHLSR
jgi:DNA-binding NarL/FixJ family response regulator